MKNVLIVVSTKDGVEPRTRACIDVLRSKGAAYAEQCGCSDVALARNIALTQACVTMNQYRELDTVLMIDDDMDFTEEDAQKVIETSKALKVAVSACAISSSHVFTGEPISKSRWATGLAFLAIPKSLLIDVAERSEKAIIVDDGGSWECTVFTWTGTEGKKWCGEDKRLTRRLGGVHMIPVCVGHIKKQPLYFAMPSDVENGKVQDFLNKALENYKDESN